MSGLNPLYRYLYESVMCVVWERTTNDEAIARDTVYRFMVLTFKHHGNARNMQRLWNYADNQLDCEIYFEILNAVHNCNR